MPLSLKKIFTGAFAIVASLARLSDAMAPLSDNVHTETALPQEIGSMTSDGVLIYSMNVCTIEQTTICEMSISTGAPAPSYGPGIPVSGSAPYESEAVETTSPTAVYPVPTEDAGTTDGGTPSVEDGYTATISTEATEETGINTATSTSADEEPSSTSDGGSDTSATTTGPGGTATDAPSSANSLGALAGYVLAMMVLL